MARRTDKTFESVPLAVALALCAVFVIAALFALTYLLPNRVRCVVKENNQIQKYGISWIGVVDKKTGVDLVALQHRKLSTRCGLSFAARVDAVPAGSPAYLQTVTDYQKCGNLEALPACDDLFFPLLGPSGD